jgi:hypothetical protein
VVNRSLVCRRLRLWGGPGIQTAQPPNPTQPYLTANRRVLRLSRSLIPHLHGVGRHHLHLRQWRRPLPVQLPLVVLGEDLRPSHRQRPRTHMSFSAESNSPAFLRTSALPWALPRCPITLSDRNVGSRTRDLSRVGPWSGKQPVIERARSADLAFLAMEAGKVPQQFAAILLVETIR